MTPNPVSADWRRLADALPEIVWMCTSDGNTFFFNARWYDLTGATEAESHGEAWLQWFHPEERDSIVARWQASVASGEPYEIEYRLRHRDGSWHWQLGRGLPVRDADGAIEQWLGTCTDIEALKAAEAQRSLIASELSHRIRNIFAVVGALVSLSARSQPEAQDFSQALKRRIGALATAHDYVRPADNMTPTPPGLKGLLEQLLAPYQTDNAELGADRTSVAGDDVAIGPTAATALALIFHEFATNAVKHGALGVDRGRVAVTIVADAEWVHVEWREIGGPALAGAPIATGFGTQMSRHAMSAWPGARFEMQWVAAGLVVRLDVPRDKLKR